MEFSTARNANGELRRTAKKSIPPDLAEMAARMGRNALALHYGISYNTMVRMLADAGLEAVKAQPVPRQRITPSQRRGYAGPKSAFTGLLPRDLGSEGEAADFLRRETRANVYRCDERGAWTETKAMRTHWRVGNSTMTGAELIQRAQRHGFDPDAWRHIPTGLAIAGCEADKSQRQGMPQSQGA